jgi:[ribosomal protein S5]-alanine N-acetyltransferase
MMILREFWGEGIGRRMLEIMEAHAKDRGIARLEAQVRTKNERGIKLYRRMGFQIEGTRKHAALIDGKYQDEFFIAKILENGHPWSPPRLETERLVLRALEANDAPNIFEYARNPNVSRFTLWEPHQTLKDSEAYVFDYAMPYYRNKTPEPWGITLKSDPSKVIGTVGLFWVSKAAKSMELAYAIGESHWGQGLVVEASRAAIDYVFQEFDAVRIQARCKAENQASARVMEKLGMAYEGTLKSSLFHRDRHWDMKHYAVLRGGNKL